ncbi:MAG: hypothetical protein DRO11_02570 [Methanobacteriota archaeon]|nr:MAG: hypothetical protein DRO11_02570 [Euryarchaeota archaeon]
MVSHLHIYLSVCHKRLVPAEEKRRLQCFHIGFFSSSCFTLHMVFAQQPWQKSKNPVFLDKIMIGCFSLLVVSSWSRWLWC